MVAVNLAKQLRSALRDMRWKRIHDFGPEENVFPAGRAAVLNERPNLDLAVIALDGEGNLLEAANVILSRDQPRGLISDLDGDFNTTNITWQRWNQKRWDGSRRWINTAGELPAKERLGVSRIGTSETVFMSPYPASLFKLPLAFFLLEETAEERIALSDIRKKLRKMLTVSSNQATNELLKTLHDNKRIGAMNRRFERMGLDTIQIKGTDPATGQDWNVGEITMTSMDTAKLLWLIQSDPQAAPLWTQPDGKHVRSKLNKKGQRILLKHLGNQAFSETLSTANFGVGGSSNKTMKSPPNVEPGIPSRVPEKFIDEITGEVAFNYEGFPINYGEDVRPYNNTIADKDFLHKTGLTYNFGSDAGILRDGRTEDSPSYIISFISNLGFRYTDPAFADRKSYPVYDDPGPIAYVQEIPRLGNRVDKLMDDLFSNLGSSGDT